VIISTASFFLIYKYTAAPQMGDKLSTEDILAAIRGGAAPADKPVAAKPAEAPAGSEAPPTAAAAPASATGGSVLDSIRSSGAAKPATAPAGTSDILAAARSGAAKPAGGAAPKGTGDIMAAIRGGGAAVPASKKAPAAKPAAPAVDEVAVSGLSVTELIKAARAGQSPEDAEVKPVMLPSKPLKGKVAVKPAAKSTGVIERRGFLGDLVVWVTTPVIVAWVAFSGALGMASLGMARFMMPNVLVEPPTKFKIGPPTDYSPGTVSTKWKAQFGVWIVNAEVQGVPMIYALSTVCTHLGCTPNWLEGEQKFKCPCHGSGFRKNGFNFEGPAPRPLERMGIRLAPDGMLEVDKSVKFQQELGQWENAASYVPVV
jgi:cytochrome b6-f complex iron-sulfur subunit